MRLAHTAVLRSVTEDVALEFPIPFLRENLRECWDASSLQRTVNNLEMNITLVSGTPLTSSSWQLEFSDGATGVFHLPTETAVDIEQWEKQLWGGSDGSGHDLLSLLGTHHAEGGIRFSWDELEVEVDTSGQVRTSEQLGEGRANLSQPAAAARAKLIEATHVHGMAMVDGVPDVSASGIHLADQIVGAVETTNFGYQFVIKNVDDPHNLAFDSIGLQHHTDFTYCRKCPDVALFHCLNNADEGGDSLWLDGFRVAEVSL